jgi:hypothetical protein
MSGSMLASISQRTMVMACAACVLASSIGTVLVERNSRDLADRITSKRRELGAVLVLKETYQAKKEQEKQAVVTTKPVAVVTLGSVEQMVKKSFASGKIVSLKPRAAKDGKMVKSVIDAKISGAGLSEAVTFYKTLDEAGIKVDRYSLNTQSNGSLLDVSATIIP